MLYAIKTVDDSENLRVSFVSKPGEWSKITRQAW